jgi:hypothetical protein
MAYSQIFCQEKQENLFAPLRLCASPAAGLVPVIRVRYKAYQLRALNSEAFCAMRKMVALDVEVSRGPTFSASTVAPTG